MNTTARASCFSRRSTMTCCGRRTASPSSACRQLAHAEGDLLRRHRGELRQRVLSALRFSIASLVALAFVVLRSYGMQWAVEGSTLLTAFGAAIHYFQLRGTLGAATPWVAGAGQASAAHSYTDSSSAWGHPRRRAAPGSADGLRGPSPR